MTSRRSRYELPEKEPSPQVQRAAQLGIYILIMMMGFMVLWFICLLASIDYIYY